jgi:transcription elongation factor Elf1
MRIKEIINQHRRDFTALYECEHCGHIQETYGYDDVNFHKNVIPTMICPKCKKKASDSYRPLTTKYPEGFQI